MHNIIIRSITKLNVLKHRKYRTLSLMESSTTTTHMEGKSSITEAFFVASTLVDIPINDDDCKGFRSTWGWKREILLWSNIFKIMLHCVTAVELISGFTNLANIVAKVHTSVFLNCTVSALSSEYLSFNQIKDFYFSSTVELKNA